MATQEESTNLIVQPPGLGHGGQGRPFTADVAEDLKNHEAEEEEVETGTDPCHDYERHLRKRQSRKCRNNAFLIRRYERWNYLVYTITDSL